MNSKRERLTNVCVFCACVQDTRVFESSRAGTAHTRAHTHISLIHLVHVLCTHTYTRISAHTHTHVYPCP